MALLLQLFQKGLSFSQPQQLRKISVSIHAKSKIAIIGGGLAGLSVAFHLLTQRNERNADSVGLAITVIDKSLPGKGGASAVAGGYVPFVLFHILVGLSSDWVGLRQG